MALILAVAIFHQTSLADSLFKNNYFELAEVEYKRLFFCDSNLFREEKLRLNYTISLLHINAMKGYREAERLLSDFPALDEESKIRLGLCLGECGFHSFAIEVLAQTNERRWTGYYCLLNGQFNKARELFLAAGESELVREVDSFYKIRKKSPLRAMVISMALPGAGELYGSNLRLALSDFLLSFGSGYLFYDAIREKRYVDAGLIFSFLFNRFYFGSISNAGRIVQKKNEENDKKFLNEFKRKYLNEEN